MRSVNTIALAQKGGVQRTTDFSTKLLKSSFLQTWLEIIETNNGISVPEDPLIGLLWSLMGLILTEILFRLLFHLFIKVWP